MTKATTIDEVDTNSISAKTQCRWCGIPAAPAIIITGISLLRCSAGFFNAVFAVQWLEATTSTLTYAAELLEFLYYQLLGRGERDLGPRKKIGANVVIFMSLNVAIAATVFVSLISISNGSMGMGSMWWPLFIYVVFGNAFETSLLLRYKVNEERNWTLITSKVLLTAANIMIITTATDYYYLPHRTMKVFTVTVGLLYIIHGITLYFGLFKYYSYPIIKVMMRPQEECEMPGG